MLAITNIFGIKTLHKLNIEILTVKDFVELQYADKVKYFRLFYIKTNLSFLSSDFNAFSKVSAFESISCKNNCLISAIELTDLS